MPEGERMLPQFLERMAKTPLLLFLLFAALMLGVCVAGWEIHMHRAHIVKYQPNGRSSDTVLQSNGLTARVNIPVAGPDATSKQRHEDFALDLLIIFLLAVAAVGGFLLSQRHRSSIYYRMVLETGKKSQARVREWEQLTQTVISSVQEGLIVYDRDLRYRLWNPFMEKLTGISSESLIGKAAFDFFPHLREQGIDTLLARALAGEIVQSPDTKYTVSGTGKTGWVTGVYGPQRSSEGNIIGVVGTLLDISDRKRAEESLAAEREHLTVTLRSIGDGVISTDNNGRVVLMNKVAETLTGWSMEEAVGRPLGEIFTIVNEPDRRPCENPAEKVLATDSVLALAPHTLLIDRHGRERIIADSCAPIKNADGAMIGAVMVFRDNTEKQKALDNMIKAEKLESIGVLAGGIAHDFNNLLGGVFGYIGLAREYVGAHEKAFTFLSKALNAFHRAGDLTKQLLTFSKGGAPVKKTAHLEPILREMAQFALSGSNVRCMFSIPKNLWLCDIDKNQIGQAIDNIVINAKQAMPDGGDLTIAAENYRATGETTLPLAKGEYVKIAIRDHGSGIAKEHLSRIFDPFFTTKQKGSGLGLATCFSIIQRHDGCIDVETELGKGSTFYIYLPVSKSPLSPEQKTEAFEMKGKGRLLVMDGEDFIREITKEMLKLLGYETVLAESGEEALSLVKESVVERKPFDAVILDLTIAGSMGGMETVKVLRAIDPNIKAIVSSGYSYDPMMADPTSYGFQDKIKKPFLKEHLAEVLNRVLAHEE
jgi:PAS domain S-box-containing protein